MRVNKSLITFQQTGAGTGSVTSVAMTVPTGLTISGSPITSSGTLALGFASGVALPPSQTGNSGKYLTTDGTNLSWATVPSATNIYNTDGTLTGDRTITLSTYYLRIAGTSTTSFFSTGNVTIGGTSDTGLYKLDVQGTGRFTSDILVNNITIGRGGGNSDTNTAVGNGALTNNTTGVYSVAIGRSAMSATHAGSGSVAVGWSALSQLTSGVENTSVGLNSLYATTTGNYNVAIGSRTLESNNGSDNVAVGGVSLQYITSGSGNTAIGRSSGRFVGASGTVQNQTSSNSIYIGNGTRGSANGNTNEIVLGYNSVGLGSNTMMLGNSSIVTTSIYGNTIIGGTTDTGLYKLDVQGTGRFTGDVNFGMWKFSNSGQFLESTNTSSTIYFNGPILIKGNASARNINIGTGTTGDGISIGENANSIGGNISFGSGSIANNGKTISIGNNAKVIISTSNKRQLAIGNNSTVLHESCIALNGAVTTASNQFVCGVMWFPSGNEQSTINEVYFGSGVQRQYYDSGSVIGTSGVGTSYSINGSGAYGTDFAGGNITIAGGKGTGTGTPGDVIISTSAATSTGTTLQSLTQRWWVKGETGTFSNVSTPNASAQLQIDSTAKGFLPPRMTNAQRTAISSPAVGLIVYCTDTVEGLYIYKSTGWTFII